jgi:nitrogen fixation protein FixH
MKWFPKIKNPWPVGLVLFFIVFAAYIIGFVIFASRQKMDLVRNDYYDQEIRFQKQIDRVNRTEPMRSNVGLDYDAAQKSIRIRLPRAAEGNGRSGSVSFYRPSDASLDTTAALAVDAQGTQRLDVGGLRPGLWKVRVAWSSEGREYFFEKPVDIVSARP